MKIASYLYLVLLGCDMHDTLVNGVHLIDRDSGDKPINRLVHSATAPFSDTVNPALYSSTRLQSTDSVGLSSPEVTSIRINCGELQKSYTDVSNHVWGVDSYFKNTGLIRRTKAAILGTNDAIIYRKWRYGDIQYEIPVPEGEYRISLYFSENYYLATRSRLFDLVVEGQVVFHSLDILKEAGGPFTAYSFDVVSEVLDGFVSIQLNSILSHPVISAIKIEQQGHHLAHAVPGGPYHSVDVNNVGYAFIRVDGSLSHTHAPGHALKEWIWSSNGHELGRGQTTSINLTVGMHTVNLEVIDDAGNVGNDLTAATVLPNGYPVLTALSPPSGRTTGGEAIRLIGSGFNYTEQHTIVHFGDVELSGESEITVVNATTILVRASPTVIIGTPVQVKITTLIGSSNVMLFAYLGDGIPINFLSGTVLKLFGPTTLAFGTDGRLYVGTRSGVVVKLTLDDNYTVIDSVVSNAVALNSPNEVRTILGITMDPLDQSPDPSVYVSHSLLFHGSNESFTGLAINGKVSRVSGASLNIIQDVVTGLPVSDADHAVNGLEFDDSGNLYIQIGGNTNAGVPGPLTTYSIQEDNAMGSATLVGRMSDPSFNGTVLYSSDGQQSPGSGVEVFATGQRNSYDIVYHSNGNLYATDNGPNKHFGGRSTSCTSRGPDPSEPDKINRVVVGAFYGQPNRARGQCVWRSADEPSDASYTAPLAQSPSSTNGIVEFHSEHFGGLLRGNLILGQYLGSVLRVVLAPDGKSVISGPTVLIESSGALDVTQGPDGTLFVAQIQNNAILFYKPSDPISDVLVVKSVWPRRGSIRGGNKLRIYGEHFSDSGQPSVKVGGRNCAVVDFSQNCITCLLPSAFGFGAVDVEVMSGVTTSVMKASYRYIGHFIAPVNINAGETHTNYTDSKGQLWLTDRCYSADSVSLHRYPRTFRNNHDGFIYSGARLGPLGNNLTYHIPLPNGKYLVTIYFSELIFTKAGRRVFHVYAQNVLVHEGLDVFVQSGGRFVAFNESFVILVESTVLAIDLIPVKNKALISGIQIEPMVSRT